MLSSSLLFKVEWKTYRYFFLVPSLIFKRVWWFQSRNCCGCWKIWFWSTVQQFLKIWSSKTSDLLAETSSDLNITTDIKIHKKHTVTFLDKILNSFIVSMTFTNVFSVSVVKFFVTNESINYLTQNEKAIIQHGNHFVLYSVTWKLNRY